MPGQVDFFSSTVWTVPQFVSNITVTAIGGGSSGFADDDGTALGFGGGGGAFVQGSYPVTAGTNVNVVVGQGGVKLFDNYRSGSASTVTASGINVSAGGGGASGGGSASGGNILNINGTNGGGVDTNYQGGRGATCPSGQTVTSAQRGGHAGNAGGISGTCGYILSNCYSFYAGYVLGKFSGYGGKGISLSGAAGPCSTTVDATTAGGYYGGGGGGGNGTLSGTGSGANGAVRIYFEYDPPTIFSFTATPNPQGSFAGIPQYSVTLNWTTQGATSFEITSNAGEFYTTTGTSIDVSGLPQSVAGSNSPAQRTYTLKAIGPDDSTTQDLLVNIYNDNTPTTAWTTSFSNLEPNTSVDLPLGTLAGVDMPTTISAAGAGNFVGTGGSFSGTKNFANGQGVFLRTTTLPFNTDTSGQTGIYGKPNSKTVTVTTPSGSFNVTVSTRAPRISEDFDYADVNNKYPFEDIDLITNNPLEYVTSTQITADDIEIAQEIKLDDPDAEVSINNGTWQNVREI